nr:immunoglobulin light chain junction region [Macaca mulatta]MOV78895.1 immunoglobulin light chain junction region [Macaca mulatta]MOV79922.1 immunoglobulin light chain junction region [Macaca mulatta]MOV80798.1 immunoglobulin light chain junction region [Macaca mulatta]MOV81584.1 immunoglobulin light chain junction region [Macaca mulatta]
CQQHDNMPLTF